MRHSNVERRGVNAVEAAFIDEFDWIFREQPIADVGIDAFVEKKDNDTPAGKFMALQVKSGEGNFKVKPDKLTYYVSNIHYNYWLNLNIPIVLVAYIPGERKCYWQEISKKNLKKTPKRWKIDIPMSNVLNKNAKERFELILAEIDTTDIISEIYTIETEDVMEVTDLLLQSTGCSESINRIIVKLGASFRASRERNDVLLAKGHSLNSATLNSALKKQSLGIVAQSKRLEIEAKLFSEIFPNELFELEQYLYSWIKHTGNIPEPLYKQIKLMPKNLEHALNGTEQFKSGTIELRNKVPQLKKAITSLGDSLEQLCDEYRIALELVNSINSQINES